MLLTVLYLDVIISFFTGYTSLTPLFCSFTTRMSEITHLPVPFGYQKASEKDQQDGFHRLFGHATLPDKLSETHTQQCDPLNCASCSCAFHT